MNLKNALEEMGLVVIQKTLTDNIIKIVSQY